LVLIIKKNGAAWSYMVSRFGEKNFDVNNMWIYMRENLNIINYLKFLYEYKNTIYIKKILHKKYNFIVNSYDDRNYPLCNPKIGFSLYDHLYFIATK
jgi:hypothetical protein